MAIDGNNEVYPLMFAIVESGGHRDMGMVLGMLANLCYESDQFVYNLQ